MAVPMSCRDRPAATPEMCLSVCDARGDYEDLFICGEDFFMRCVCVCVENTFLFAYVECVQSEDKTRRGVQGRTGAACALT
jgi:hypothetical protein